MENYLIRKAKIKDAPEIVKLISHYAQEGIMLSKPLSKIYENIRDFTVVEEESRVIGCGALHIYWDDLAEVRSLVISPEKQRAGFGQIIVKNLLQEARTYGIHHVFALSYKPEFFKKLGFGVVEKEVLPQKIWKDCLDCVHFPNCNETALKINLNGEHK
ncbi:N-acetyltransferase [candidate division KSB1 bacterium]|nr:N-acetyltransferase [candidate division KSB1 bacterium]